MKKIEIMARKKKNEFDIVGIVAATLGGGIATVTSAALEDNVDFVNENQWVTPSAFGLLSLGMVYFADQGGAIHSAGLGIQGAIGSDMAFMAYQKIRDKSSRSSEPVNGSRAAMISRVINQIPDENLKSEPMPQNRPEDVENLALSLMDEEQGEMS